MILAIDAGSSYLKTVAFDRAGRILARACRAYETVAPSPGLAEQDPDCWLDLAAATIVDLRREGIATERLAGIGLSGRGGLAIFLDADGNVLTRSWLDHRHRESAAALVAAVSEDLDYQTRGLASKTYHLRRTDPAGFARLARALFVRDFLLYRLTGVVATDPSSGPPDGVWPRQLWDAVGFPVTKLAPVHPHTIVAGQLTPWAADRLGLPAGLPVGLGGHDGACANAGAGAIRPGQVCLTLGTQGVVRAIASAPPANARARRVSPYHFLPGRWCCSGDLVRAGSVPTLVARLLTSARVAPPSLDEAHARLTAEARAVAPGSGGIVYLPFPSGQISPELRPDARAAFVGMSAEASPTDLYRAALEGVAFAFRSVVERERAIGLPLDDFRLTGGGAQNDLWVQILADVLGETLTIVEPEEGARGAALFLAVGLGWFDSPESAADAWVRPVARVHPSANARLYEPIYQRFCRLSDAIYEVSR